MKNCQCHTDIPRDGSGQLTRFLKTLDPNYAKIDDRSLTDLLVFVKKYASQIRFYKLHNDSCNEDESWCNFFKNDLAVLAALVAQFDLQKAQKDYLEIRNDFEENPSIERFKALFEPITKICLQLDQWLAQSSVEFPLHQDIKLAIHSTLYKQILNLLILDKSAMLVNNGSDLDIKFVPKDDKLWHLDDAEILLKIELYTGTTLSEQLFHASLEIDTIFNVCFGVMTQIVGNADDYLAFSLEKFPKHQPHIALFIAFLQLFKLAQDQLNGLTEKHLNYYYRDILHLTEKPAQPDHVNLIFELAKGTDTFALPLGTQLSAGKDALGIDQVYETDREIVLNKAKVKEIKNVFIKKNENKLTFYARPVADSADGKGIPFKDNEAKWNPFGVDAVKKQSSCGDIQELTDAINIAQIGFAIASPQLRLEGGNRKIEFEIKDLGKLLENKREAIKIALTGEKGWLEIFYVKKNEEILKKLEEGLKDKDKFLAEISFETGFYLEGNTIHIFLPIKEKAIINYDAKIHSEHKFNTSSPVLQVLIDGTEIDTSVLDKITFEGFKLNVIVGSINKEVSEKNEPNFDGVRKLVLQNDDSIINTDTFSAFGIYPSNRGSFYIGSDEVFNKQISDLSVNIDWLSKRQLNSLGLELSILNNKNFQKLIHLEEIPVESGGENPDSTEIVERPFNITLLDNNVLEKSSFPSNRFQDFKEVTTYNSNKTNRGFLRISLPFGENDFNFPTTHLAAGQSISTIDRLFLLGHLTKAKSVSLSYRSEIKSLDGNLDQFFHILPFGNAEIVINTPTPNRPETILTENILPNTSNATERTSDISSINPSIDRSSLFRDKTTFDFVALKIPTIPLTKFSLLPNFKYGQNLEKNIDIPFTNQYTGKAWQEGNLYIGIEDLVPPQNLSLLFQIAEGTGFDSLEEETQDMPKVHWSYLVNNQWKPLLDSNIIMDTTYGLQTTGIILFDIPEQITNNNTLITNGLHWISASVDAGSHRMPYLIKIVAQAISATFKNQQNSPEHFQKPLPANSISKLIPKPVEIKKVEQPFDTYDGTPAEIGKEFWTRVSERLRHKDRAITVKDYEKIVLEYFPNVFKVKAIGHTDPNCLCREPEKPTTLPSCCGPQVAPGHVMIIPIANLRNRNAINILQPKTPRRILLEIEKFLQKRTSPFVKIHARNPIYEEVLTAFRVKFKSGVDNGYYLELLNEEIKKYLTPWVYDEFTDVEFGGQIYASNVIDFIEERPYVDFISDFMMFLVKCDCCKDEKHKIIEDKNQLKESAKDKWQTIRETIKIDVSVIQNKLILKNDTGTDFNYDQYERALLLKVENWIETKDANLNGINLEMATLIEPSSARSLLVSVEKHIIMLYEENKTSTPCQKKAKK